MMCRWVAAMCAALAVGAVSGQLAAEPVRVSSRIEAVTVFPSGAEVVRTSHVRIAPDTRVVVFSDMPAEAIPGSIRVDGKAAGMTCAPRSQAADRGGVIEIGGVMVSSSASDLIDEPSVHQTSPGRERIAT